MKSITVYSIALFIGSFCLAQTQRGVFTHERTTSGDELVTVHLPAAEVNRTVRFVGVTIYSALACAPQLKRDGTAPTATAATAAQLNAESVAAVAVPYNASNAGSLIHVKTYNLVATEEKVILLDDKTLTAGRSLHVQTGCAARVFFQWREY